MSNDRAHRFTREYESRVQKLTLDCCNLFTSELARSLVELGRLAEADRPRKVAFWGIGEARLYLYNSPTVAYPAAPLILRIAVNQSKLAMSAARARRLCCDQRPRERYDPKLEFNLMPEEVHHFGKYIAGWIDARLGETADSYPAPPVPCRSQRVKEWNYLYTNYEWTTAADRAYTVHCAVHRAVENSRKMQMATKASFPPMIKMMLDDIQDMHDPVALCAFRDWAEERSDLFGSLKLEWLNPYRE